MTKGVIWQKLTIIEWKKGNKGQDLRHHFAKLCSKLDMQGNSGQREIFILDMGEIEFPTGDILVRDPLVWLNRDEKVYLTLCWEGMRN